MESGMRLLQEVSSPDKPLTWQEYIISWLQSWFRQGRLKLHIPQSHSTLNTCMPPQRADIAPTFTQFLELPTELRCMVYEYLFADELGEPHIRSRIPKITRVSPLLREEAMEYYFQQTTFEIALYRRPGQLARIRSRSRWLLSVPSEYLRHIRHFSVSAMVKEASCVYSYDFELEVHLAALKPVVQMSSPHLHGLWYIAEGLHWESPILSGRKRWVEALLRAELSEQIEMLRENLCRAQKVDRWQLLLSDLPLILPNEVKRRPGAQLRVDA